MPSEKKLVAAAAFTRGQANFFAAAVEAAQAKVERAQQHLDAAEEALERAIEKAEQKEQEAQEAREAAQGLPSFAHAEVAAMGVNA